VARLTAELVQTDPLSADDSRRLRERLTAALAPVADLVADFGPKLAVGTSGTFCDLARMVAARANGSTPLSVNQLCVHRQDFLEVHEQLLSTTADERLRMSGLDARRVDLIPAGSMVLATAMELFGFDELIVSEWALREGIVLEAIGHHDPADWAGDPRALRRASVIGLARRCGWDEGHARQVATVAGDLFDRTLPLHRLSGNDRELLEYAALLHDIGEHVSTESHHKHTAYLVQHGRLRGFDPEEVAAVAAIGRYHRNGDPKQSHEPYGSLPPERQERVAVLSSLLRIADGLDRSHQGAVDGVDVEIRDDTVRVLVHAAGEVDLDLWGARRKRGLFERLFNRRLELIGPGAS
jgi:exopolyphosphatase/guanosine-5'-triphosphate,3'-diphosphate pyrophosphatase